MPKTEQDWIKARLDEAAAAAPVSPTVSTAINEQLRGLMRERALRPGELTELAKKLLALPAPPLGGAPQ
jgi:hypothetical protein